MARKGKMISDPSGDDKMVGGKLVDPKHDDRIVTRKGKRGKVRESLKAVKKSKRGHRGAPRK